MKRFKQHISGILLFRRSLSHLDCASWNAERGITRCLRLLMTLILLSSATIAVGQSEAVSTTPQANLRQVTTHPLNDLAARLSPDGKWMLISSQRTGNYDIWLRNMETGFLRQLTKHRADQFYPVWDKKQRYIVYVSQESDAHGDLFRLNLRKSRGDLLPKGKAERITFYMGFDGYPTVSPDGEQIAWVSERSGRPEIWLQNKRRQYILQLTHDGATHPAWSPRQEVIAFTSFRQNGGNGDIWLLNLKTAPELLAKSSPLEFFEKSPSLDSLELDMWPVTTGPCADGFPTWTSDGQQIIFVRNDLDTNRDGFLSPTDHAVLWAADVAPDSAEGRRINNPSFEMFRDTFHERLTLSARPLTPACFSAQQPDFSADNKTYFVSFIRGNADVWSFSDLDFYSIPTDTAMVLDFINRYFPLPYNLNGRQLDSLFDIKSLLTQELRDHLWERITALHQIIDADTTGFALKASAMYEAGMCYTLLDHPKRAQLYFGYVVNNFPAEQNDVVWSELLLQVLEALEGDTSQKAITDQLINATLDLRQKYPNMPGFLAQSDIVLGGLWTKKQDFSRAEEHYRNVAKSYGQLLEFGAQSQYMLGELYERLKEKQKARNIYYGLLQNYKDQGKWSSKANKRLLAMAVEEAKNDSERIVRYLELHKKFQELDYASVEPLSRAARILSETSKTDQAIALLDSLIQKTTIPAEGVFAMRLQRINILLRTGEYSKAVSSLVQLEDDYSASHPHLAQKATQRLVDLLLVSAADSKQSQDYAGAVTRYREILKLDPYRVEAHQGYVESMCQLGNLEEVIEEYTLLNEQTPNNEELRYALGLAYSFKATPTRDGVTLIRDISRKDLEYSNKILREALSFDYNLIQVYLTLSYNYEMLETLRQWRKNRPKNFWTRAGEAIIAPLVWLYQPIANRHRGDVTRHYEHAIQVLTAGYILNDEKLHPDLEARVALNMANNYYNLGEYGFNKAYDFYHLRMRYDSTFVDDSQEAYIKERMGHCAFVTDDLEPGARYLKRAIELYEQMNLPDKVLINIKRLALLYEFSEDSHKALDYYQQAAEIERERRLYDGLLRSYRSIAYHHLLLNNLSEAAFYANQALALLDDGRVPRSQGKAIRPQFGILGLYFPIPYDLRKIGAKSVLHFSTDEEEAILYSILAATFRQERQFDKALALYKKKLAIYEQRHDYEAQAIFQNNIAYLYFIMGDYHNAWSWFVNSYAMCNKTKNINGQMLNIANAGHLLVTSADTGDKKWQATLPGYQAWLIEKIDELLASTRDSEHLYAQNRVHLYMALADLIQLDFSTAEEMDLAALVQYNLLTIQQTARADTLLNRALLISQRYKLRPEENTICFKRGQGFLVLGETMKALDQFIACRKMAAQLRNADILWRANTAIGNILITLKRDNPEQSNSLRQPLHYFLQAIEISENNRQTIPGLSAPRLRQRIEDPYRAAIKVFIEQGATERALDLAERMRERNYLDLLGDSNLSLGDGKRQELYSLVDSLKREINELQLLLLQSDQQIGQSADSPEVFQLQLLYLQDEYTLALEDVRREAPEIESLIKITPVDISEIKRLLPDSLAVIYQIADTRRSYFWTITKDTLSFTPVSMDKQSVTGTLHNALFDSAEYHLAAEFKSVFIAASALPVNRIVFIPDYDFLLFPWSFILQNQAPTAKPLSTVCSSLTGFANALKNSHLTGNTLYFAASMDKESVFERDDFQLIDPVPQQTGNAFFAQRSPLAQADIIHIEARVFWDVFAPSFTQITFAIPESQPATLLVRDLYTLKRGAASHITLHIDTTDSTAIAPELFVALERALTFGNVSSLLFVFPSNKDTVTDFYRDFYHQLSEHTPGRAFTKAKTDRTLSDKSANEWHSTQLFGFGGIEEQKQEDMLLAIENLSNRAQTAFENREWLKALQLYSQIKASGQNDQIDDIQSRLIACAINGGFWDRAVQFLEEMAERRMRLNQWGKVADAYRHLAAIYQYQKDAQNARRVRTNYERIVREYGLDYDLAYAWRNIADMLGAAGNVRNAVEFYLLAVSEYKSQNDLNNQASIFQKVGNLYSFELGDIAAALDYYDRATAALDPRQSAEQLLSLEFDKGRTYYHYDVLTKARLYTHRALETSREQQDQLVMNQCELLLAQIAFASGNSESAFAHLGNMQPSVSQALEIDALLLKSRILAEQNYLIESENVAKQCLTLASRVYDQERQVVVQMHLAALYLYQKKYSEALLVIEDALTLINGNSRSEIHIRLLSAAFLLGMDEQDRALQQLQIVQDKASQQHDSGARAHCYFLLSHAENDSSQALAFAQKAIALADSLALLPVSWRAQWRLAQLKESRNTFIQIMHEGLKSVLLSLPATEFASHANGLLASENQFFYDYADSLVEANEYDFALHIVEKMHERSKRRAQSLHNSDSFISPSDRLQADSLKEQIMITQSKLVAMKNQPESLFDSAKFDSLRQELAALLSRHQQSTQKDESSTDVRELAASLPSDTDILRFFHTEKRFYVWHVSKGNVELHIRNLDMDILEQQLAQLYTRLAARESVEELSNELYQKLLSPVEKIEKSPALIIIPFGKLYYIPFALLAQKEATPLGLEKRLSYSLSLAEAAQFLTPASTPRPGQSVMALVPSSERSNTFAFTANVAASLDRYYKDVLFIAENDSAHPKEQFDALYMGGRVELNPRFPFDYKTKVPGTGEAWQTPLQNWQAQNFSRFIVFHSGNLSAYTFYSGQEYLGFFADVLEGDVKGLLSSQWLADELAAAVLIKRFFRYLSEDESYGEALRRAQKTVHDRIDSHPSAWAAYRLIGTF
ncbi:CHAT domain-containing protein [candidate division KSB1 bacterium]|nr:PD40 domain-containing protein [candidate division KSB1 bacterium]RQW02612.1 MAG: CHAT domain-containing protein [candidate division KSB1 bacterium]